MGSSNIKDVLTAFSPSLDLLAICSGDSRIKIWNTLNGQIQTEFADIASSDATSTYTGSMKGHLSIDYTCMKWLSLENKKKRKHTSSLIVLGTGSGDVLALDVSAGQLNWRIDDCHPGGVKAVSSSANGSCVYTAGADGMICKIDCKTGNLLEKFKASTKAVSCMSVSSDGKTIATAAAQLKIFSSSSDHKKIQKFFGHPGSVRCLVFTEDGKYILSSAVGERYVAVWRINEAKKKSVSCVLAMDHPAVFLDSRCSPSRELDNVGVCVLAISEVGDCYVWFGNSIEELRNVKPTKISLPLEDISSRNHMGALPAVYAAKLESISNPTSGQVLLVHGLLVKPSFQKISVQSGSDIKLNFSDDGILLRLNKSVVKSKKAKDAKKVTALDRANAEDALLPIPKLFDSHVQEKEFRGFSGMEVMDDLVRSNESVSMEIEDEMVKGETDVICMEDQMRSLGILDDKNDLESNIKFSSSLLKDIDLEATLPMRKIRATVLTMEPSEAYKILEVLLSVWQSRSSTGKYALPWIYSILVIHGRYLISQENMAHMLDSLIKMAGSRGSAVETLLQLSGRLQLVTTQINKASKNTIHSVRDSQVEESEDEDKEDYFEEEGDDASEISSDDDDDS